MPKQTAAQIKADRVYRKRKTKMYNIGLMLYEQSAFTDFDDFLEWLETAVNNGLISLPDGKGD